VNICYGLPKIVLKYIVGDIGREWVTMFLLDGSLDRCLRDSSV